MGCLCSNSSTLGSCDREITRSATAYNTQNNADISFRAYSPQKNFYSEYRLLKTLIGSGLCGEIRLCKHFLTEKIFAVKIITKANLSQRDSKNHIVENQVKLLKTLDHPSILKLHEFYEDSCNYFLVMEYIKGGDLYSMIEKTKKISEAKAAIIMKQLLSALAYLHSQKIVHRDIKPENILIEENGDEIAIKLIDFDTATKFNEEGQIKGIQGTIYYMAPEIFSGSYSEKCDVWSAGVILYSMITNNFPFGGKSEEEIIKSIRSSIINWQVLNSCSISKQLSNFFCKLLQPNVKKRLTASEASKHC